MKYLISLILICFVFFGHSQRPTKEVDALLLKSKKRYKEKYIDEGSKIHYWLEGDKKKQKGVLDSIGDNFIITNNQVIYLSNVSKIAGRSTGMSIANISGKVIVITGTLSAGLGAYLIYSAYHLPPSDDECGDAFAAVILITAGVIVGAVGVIVTAVGMIPLLIHNKRYNIQEKWFVEKGTIEKKLSRKELKEAGLR